MPAYCLFSRGTASTRGLPAARMPGPLGRVT